MITAQATGRLVKSPELVKVGDNTVCRLTIINERYTGKDNAPATEFLDIEVWGPIGETHNRELGKGHLIEAVGELRQSSWEADDGTTRRKWYLAPDRIKYHAKPRNTDDTVPKTPVAVGAEEPF